MTENPIEISKEFSTVLNFLENSNKNLFITGKAGTGKSTLLRHFLKTTKKNAVVLAPTGIAAINITGQTIHSFFRFPTQILFPHIVEKLPGDAIYRKLDIIIIDEISMVRADLLDAIDLFLRRCGPQHGKPFGGIQMVFFGDLYQLPPVVVRAELEVFSKLYESPFFFKANAFKEVEIKKIELTKIYRQADPVFIDLLEAIRHNNIKKEHFDLLNARYEPFFDPNDEKDHYITLTATNNVAADTNRKRLTQLTGEIFSYDATVEGIFRPEIYPTEEFLKMKNKAQVLFIRNDPNGRWVNGSIGTVVNCGEHIIQVEISDPASGIVNLLNVERIEWKNVKYTLNKDTKKIEVKTVGKFEQFPLKLAWAITTHKSQGQTYDRVAIDFGWGAFAHGQAYVALSRCRTIEGIKLLRQIKKEDIILDRHVVEYMNFKTELDVF